MKLIQFDDPHRKKHFDFFRSMDQPHFGITADVEIDKFLSSLKEEGLPFTATLVYLLSKAANENTAFRWRLRDEQVVEHPSIQPSFTVLTQVSEVFSFCTVKYNPDAMTFIRDAQRTMEEMQNTPSLEDEEGKDDFIFMSSFPWVSFRSMHHAMHYSPADSVPRISWGKYYNQGEKTLLPLAVQAHHALVDGKDMGHYYQAVQALLDEKEEWLS